MLRLLKHPILLISLLLNYSCVIKDQKQEDVSSISSDTDSSSAFSYPAIVTAEEDDGKEMEEKNRNDAVMLDLSGTDSIFYYLITEKTKQKGKFAQAIISADSVIDITSGQNNLLIVLLQTGTGKYSGNREDVFPFETIYSTLALLKFEDNTFTLLDQVTLPKTGGHGLSYTEIYCEPIALTSEGHAVIVNTTDAKEGAGDSGYKYHVAKIFVSHDTKLCEVLSYPVSHFQFSNSESELNGEMSYQQIYIETMLTLQEAENKLMDIFLSSNEMYPADEYSKYDFKGGDELYSWNGKRYSLVMGSADQ